MGAVANPRVAVAVRAIAVVLILAVWTRAKATEAAHIEFIGHLHQLRLGASDASSDWVTPKHYGGQPICLTMGEDLKITWVSPQPESQWKVTSAKLTSKVNGTVHWQLSGESPFMAPGTVYELPGDMPNYVDWCKIEITIVATEPPLGEEDPPPTSVPVLGFDDVYVVLTNPQAPTTTAWANILKFSTTAARGANDEHTAKQMLVWKMWQQFSYDPSQVYYTVTTGSSETFKARRYFTTKVGQCNDFADGLVCAGSVLGIYWLPMRSFENVESNSKLRIKTNMLHPAGGTPYDTVFRYHQFVVQGEVSYYDAAVRVSPGPSYNYVIDYGSLAYETALMDYLFNDDDLSWVWESPEALWDSPADNFYACSVYLTLTAE
jgi:hypothetical protein